MILNSSELIEILRKDFPDIDFLENEHTANERYRTKKSLVLEFFSKKSNEKQVLKFISLQTSDSNEHLQLEKADVLRQIDIIKSFSENKNLIKLHDWDELWHNNQLIGIYMIMEKLPSTVEKLMTDSQLFTADQVLDFLLQMDNILYEAHDQLKKPIIHCDIKPPNIGIRIPEAGVFEYVLMDFDIAVHLQRSHAVIQDTGISNVGEMRGLTPVYAAPEQVTSYLHRTGDISNRIDIYSVGAIAMQMLTGIPPQPKKSQSFYHLPWEHVNGEWHKLFSYLCHNDPRHRVRRIMDALHYTGFTGADPGNPTGQNDLPGNIKPAIIPPIEPEPEPDPYPSDYIYFTNNEDIEYIYGNNKHEYVNDDRSYFNYDHYQENDEAAVPDGHKSHDDHREYHQDEAYSDHKDPHLQQQYDEDPLNQEAGHDHMNPEQLPEQQPEKPFGKSGNQAFDPYQNTDLQQGEEISQQDDGYFHDEIPAVQEQSEAVDTQYDQEFNQEQYTGRQPLEPTDEPTKEEFDEGYHTDQPPVEPAVHHPDEEYYQPEHPPDPVYGAEKPFSPEGGHYPADGGEENSFKESDPGRVNEQETGHKEGGIKISLIKPAPQQEEIQQDEEVFEDTNLTIMADNRYAGVKDNEEQEENVEKESAKGRKWITI